MVLAGLAGLIAAGAAAAGAVARSRQLALAPTLLDLAM